MKPGPTPRGPNTRQGRPRTGTRGSAGPAPDGGRPQVVVNMAMTADGKIATSTRSVHTFGSARDGANLHALRATADAILCGARTVEETGATMGNGGQRYGMARIRRGLREHPLRVVVSGSGTISPDAEIWRHRFSPILVLTTRRASRARLDGLRTLADGVWVSPGNTLDWAAALAWLRREHGVRRLVCEGGGEVNDALFRGGWVDELRLTLCPLVFGGRDAPGIAGGIGVEKIAEAARFELRGFRRVGDEFFLIYRRPRARRPGFH
ncbi:MAG: RibD family protein [Verrucomicrobia bacterium]|nr:MAG: RibD family protein [Verrucomicrobiota bacterium]